MRRPALACQGADTDVTQTTEKVPSGHPQSRISLKAFCTLRRLFIATEVTKLLGRGRGKRRQKCGHSN
jgi:hypothetical protein